MARKAKTSRIVLALAAGALLGGCQLWPADAGYPYTTTDPMSDFGMYTHELYATITYIVCVIFAAVAALLGYTLFRFRDDGQPGNPEQIHGNTQMEIGWTMLPIGIVLIMIVPTIRTIFKIADAPPAGATDASGMVVRSADGAVAKPTVEINVIGKRWWWSFEYVGQGVVTGNQLAFPDDRPVSLMITSDTVIHSFWLPRIGGKRDAIPGRVNRIWFNMTEDIPAGKPEHIRGECAEYCGEAHALMRFEALAMDGSDYEKWLAEMQKPIKSPDAAQQEKAEGAFRDAGCAGCHAVAGVAGAVGKQGPALTAFGDRRYLAAGVHDLYPNGRSDLTKAKALLTQWIRDPNSLKPGTTKSANVSRAIDGMNIPVDADGNGVLSTEELSDEKIALIVDWLLSLKTSYPLP
jgi:cytochrome c oxidase subunit 2